MRQSLGSKAREGLLGELLRAEAELRSGRGEGALADRLAALADALAR